MSQKVLYGSASADQLSDAGFMMLFGMPKQGQTLEQVEALQNIFGKDCFTNNSELWISAPESVFIHGPQEMRSGDSQVFTTTIFSENPGDVEWQIESGEE